MAGGDPRIIQVFISRVEKYESSKKITQLLKAHAKKPVQNWRQKSIKGQRVFRVSSIQG